MLVFRGWFSDGKNATDVFFQMKSKCDAFKSQLDESFHSLMH